MCFHSKQSKDAQKVEKRFKVKIESPDTFSPSEHYNAFSFPKTPVILDKSPELIKQLSWGLIPSWSKDENIRQYTLNARIESLHEKPSFKNSINKRCLVIADGFFEWKWLDAKGKNKQKYLITRPDNELFSFGGIWSEWVNQETGEIMNSYSIVTTPANELMSEIHNSKKRMPIILTESNENEWLSGRNITDFYKNDPLLKAVES